MCNSFENNIISFDFTAKVEKEFDEIAEGHLSWQKAIGDFYHPFHAQVVETTNTSERNTGERALGVDPSTGKNISVRIGRFGPVVQLGDNAEGEEKPRFASLRRDQHLETITMDEALELFKLPRTIGEFEEKAVSVAIGRFGPYVKHGSVFVSLKKEDDPYSIVLERAIELINDKRESDSKKLIAAFKEDDALFIINGRWGAYIQYKKDNIKIPKGTVAETLSYDEVMAIIAKELKKGKAVSKSKPKAKAPAAKKK